MHVYYTYNFIKANNQNVIQQSNSVYSNNSDGEDLTVLFKMSLLRAINKVSLKYYYYYKPIEVLLESLDKMVKSLKFML